jgi:hypothetical protein
LCPPLSLNQEPQHSDGNTGNIRLFLPIPRSTTPDTPPAIQINGDNPAIVQVGASYTHLGATITGPKANLNLGITTYVNGSEMSPVQIDTSAAATDTIAYAVTDSSGNAATSIRTFVVEAAPDSAESPIGSTSTRTVIAQAAAVPNHATLVLGRQHHLQRCFVKVSRARKARSGSAMAFYVAGIQGKTAARSSILGTCLSIRRILLVREGRVRFCLGHE